MQAPEDAIKHLFVESLLPAVQVQATLGKLLPGKGFMSGVSEQHFQSATLMMDSNPNWASSMPDWSTQVAYTVPAHSLDSNQQDVILSYIDDPKTVQCYRLEASGTTYLQCADRGIDLQVTQTCQKTARPPQADVRYTGVSIRKFREFERRSASAAGIVWVFRLQMEWNGASVREAHNALPLHSASVTMSRDHTVDDYAPSTTDAAQKSLALNMVAKCGDLCLQPAQITVQAEKNSE